jgi:hypothetical protein
VAFQTIGELRQEVARENVGWTVHPRFADAQPIMRPSLGALPNTLIRAVPTQRVDVATLLRATPPTNMLLVQDLLERKILTTHPWPHLIAAPAPPGAGGGAPTRPTSVDWRNRFGWPWITRIRDQDPCEHCWIYASTALVEAMVRIEHCVWAALSEGDYIEANKVPCGQCGGAPSVLNWIASNGLAGLDCVPWVDSDPGDRTSTYWNPPPSGCGTGSMVAPPTYAPPFDRNGRTVKVPAYTSLNNTDDQKDWIANVGPIVVGFDVYSDFSAWSGNSPYKKVSSATYQGGHVMLAVGYDDTLRCWIVKNSWGTGFGNQGYYLIAYGQCNIDSYTKLGLKTTNPNPWTKRRNHAGGMIESGDGALHRNFELIAPSAGHSWTHWWRDNSSTSLPWSKTVTIGNDVADPPTFTATTYNRNFEMVYRTTSGRLHHRYFEQSSSSWKDGPIFGPTNATGAVGFVESNWGPGNFEVVTGVGNSQLQHWWRDNAGNWKMSVTFGNNIKTMGPTLLQSTWGALELVAVLGTGQMQHFWRNDNAGKTWVADQIFGSGISSPPVMIQGQYGMGDEHGNGNFELVVATPAGTIEHWWRNNQNTNWVWAKSATFGSGIARVLALVEGSYGFNLEVVALRSDGTLQHLWRDGAGWHPGVIIGTTL